MIKPTITKDWDKQRRVVTNMEGKKYVAFKDRAEEIYNASMRLYYKKGGK